MILFEVFHRPLHVHIYDICHCRPNIIKSVNRAKREREREREGQKVKMRNDIMKGFKMCMWFIHHKLFLSRTAM